MSPDCCVQSLLSWLVEGDKATLLAVWSALEALCKTDVGDEQLNFDLCPYIQPFQNLTQLCMCSRC